MTISFNDRFDAKTEKTLLIMEILEIPSPPNFIFLSNYDLVLHFSEFE